jgi:hypothetical protein
LRLSIFLYNPHDFIFYFLNNLYIILKKMSDAPACTILFVYSLYSHDICITFDSLYMCIVVCLAGTSGDRVHAERFLKFNSIGPLFFKRIKIYLFVTRNLSLTSGS